jgi:hypothetical protein
MTASAGKQLPLSESIKAHLILVNDVMMHFFASWDTLRRLIDRQAHKGLEKGGDDARQTGLLRFKAARPVMRSSANRCTFVRAECGCAWSKGFDLQLLTGTCFQMDARC